jgi:hypothetical protein
MFLRVASDCDAGADESKGFKPMQVYLASVRMTIFGHSDHFAGFQLRSLSFRPLGLETHDGKIQVSLH